MRPSSFYQGVLLSTLEPEIVATNPEPMGANQPPLVCCICLDVFRPGADMRFQRIAMPPSDVPDLDKLIAPVASAGNASACAPCSRLLSRSDLRDLKQLRGEGVRRYLHAAAKDQMGPSQDGLGIIAELSYVGWWRANKDRKAKYGRGALALFELFRRYPVSPLPQMMPLTYCSRKTDGAMVTVSAIGDMLILIDLVAKEKGSGVGGKLLRECLAICDEVGAHASGVVQAHDAEGGMNDAQLLEWYTRLGFVVEGYRDEHLKITRPPQQRS